MRKSAVEAFTEDAMEGAVDSIFDSITPEPPPSPVYTKDFSRERPLPPTTPRQHVEGGPTIQSLAPANQPAIARDPSGNAIDVTVVSPEEASEGLGEVESNPGPPILIASDSGTIGQPVMVDAIVGSINGKPVRASEFLSPLAGTLAEPLRRPGITREEWRREAMSVIFRRLWDQVQSELLVSAGFAELSPMERDGLTLFMMNEKRRLVGSGRGSEEAADRKLREQGLGGLTEFLNERRRAFLIHRIREFHVKPKVQVSRRDIEIRYNQLADKYNSPPVYQFRWIVPNPAIEDATAQIEARLKAGDSFADVASSELNTFARERGGTFAPRPTELPQAEASFFAYPELNEAARRLRVGSFAGPIEDEGASRFLFLESVEDRRKSLYEAQVEIEDAIRNERVNVEMQRYLERLNDKGNYTNIEAMAKRLCAIAEHQLLGPQTPGVGVDSTLAEGSAGVTRPTRSASPRPSAPELDQPSSSATQPAETPSHGPDSDSMPQ